MIKSLCSLGRKNLLLFWFGKFIIEGLEASELQNLRYKSTPKFDVRKKFLVSAFPDTLAHLSSTESIYSGN
jgi:hypothetical protein